MSTPYRNTPIKHWAFEDRPREKLEINGTSVLTNAELLAILLGSGSKEESAVELAKKILSSCNNDLNILGKTDIHKLMKFRGVGRVKAITILALMELTRRRKTSVVSNKTKITSSSIAYDLIYDKMVDLNHEEFWVILLNQANNVLTKYKICSGGITQTMVDVRILFKKVIVHNAVSIILVHNHPSGQLKPSQSDIQLTNKIISAGKLMDITVLDHLIISQNGYFSFADEGLI